MHKHRNLNQDFFKTWSPEMAYVLGFFAADGSMLQNSRGGHYIEFHTTDRILLNHIQKATQSDHKIAERPVRNVAWKPLYRLQIGSREWFSDLIELGFTQHKSNSLQFPAVPEDQLPHFVRGYFDGDGCVYFKQHFSKEKKKEIWVFTSLFTSGSRLFLEALHSHLKRQGISGGRIADKERGYELVFSRHDSLALYRFMYHTGQDPDLFLPRKREKLELAIEVLGLDTT